MKYDGDDCANHHTSTGNVRFEHLEAQRRPNGPQKGWSQEEDRVTYEEFKETNRCYC